MKLLLPVLISIIPFTQLHSSELIIGNTTDSLKIKSWTHEDFIKEFGFNDSAKALINLFFIKNHRAKAQTIIGGAFLAGGTIAILDPFEPGDDQKGFGDLIRPVVEPASITLGAILTASGITKLGKFTKEKLHILLLNYKNGIPIPDKYRKKLKRKYFPRRVISQAQ